MHILVYVLCALHASLRVNLRANVGVMQISNDHDQPVDIVKERGRAI